ncbi:SidA/IucD/PvdA family monooxygenase [Actinospica durhamensis]|uniref:L-lysine N6-monooxygenase MbtG n=1 Tax=Actinospica durhamensis TaxID=1508375 RepID=A0A941EQQ8_9ACTN|nr:SidA/IucD/PvdA family monooxygenase [Actinospica durhamensis]MBR7834772.1 SidA/IucD/PvdA family monooxygenase [Actinospica durhamensis]
MSAELYDLVGVGLGPFNLSLAALADPVPGLACLFLDENPGFSWHPGMMVPGATLQVPFLADLVSLVDPTSRHGYLAWLREQDRLFGFYFGEAWHVPRPEYEAYCRDVAARLGSCRFGCRVTAVRQARLADGRDGFVVCYDAEDGAPRTVLAANVVLGLGTEPVVPGALRELCGDGGALIVHSAHYLHRADWIQAAQDVTVLGSGQSGAEIVLDLLRGWHGPGRRLRWLTRSSAFEPMEYSKIGLEHFTPDYTDYFHALPEAARDQLLAGQGRLYKAVSDTTLAEIRSELDRLTHPHGPDSTGVTLLPGVEVVGGRVRGGGTGLELDFAHARSQSACTVTTERLVLATGYAPRPQALLAPMQALVLRDSRGRPVIGRDHRIALTGTDAGLYVQNGELHTHGVGTPDLGLGAYRAAAILNAVAGRELYRLPRRAAHTSFSPAAAAVTDPAIRIGRARHAQRQAPGHPAPPSQPQIPSQPEDRRERRTRSTAHPVDGLDVAGALRPAALRRERRRAAGEGFVDDEPGFGPGRDPGAGEPGSAEPGSVEPGAASTGVDDPAAASPDRR